MKNIKYEKLSQSHSSENSFSVKPQPVPTEIKNKMEKSAEKASEMRNYYNSIYNSSNVNCEKYPILTKIKK